MTKASVVVALLVSTCRDAPHEAVPAPPVSSASPSAPPSASEHPAVPGQEDDPNGTRPSKALAVVHAWNAAINAHDLALLSPLYADPVELYGTKMSRSHALAAKKASFATHAHDELSSIEITPGGHAQFAKTSHGKGGKVVEVTGYLELRLLSGVWVIDAEGDTTTDSNLERARAERCERAVGKLVYATEEAKKAQSNILEGAATSPEPVGVSGMIFPPEAGSTTWGVAVCENRPDRMPCYYHFDVDVTDGTVTPSGQSKPIATDPALKASVETACK